MVVTAPRAVACVCVSVYVPLAAVAAVAAVAVVAVVVPSAKVATAATPPRAGPVHESLQAVTDLRVGCSRFVSRPLDAWRDESENERDTPASLDHRVARLHVVLVWGGRFLP
jgi:hypothetical protein